jgi:DNA-binding MarR family transcriptional regulator
MVQTNERLQIPGEKPEALATAGALIGFTRALGARLREAPAGTGLTLAELNVLAGIEKGYDLSSTLARKLLLDAPRVSRIVESLDERGCLVREADPRDRRRCRLRLTPTGEAYLARGRAELSEAMEGLLQCLTADERAGLERAIPGMRRVLLSRVAAGHDGE